MNYHAGAPVFEPQLTAEYSCLFLGGNQDVNHASPSIMALLAAFVPLMSSHIPINIQDFFPELFDPYQTYSEESHGFQMTPSRQRMQAALLWMVDNFSCEGSSHVESIDPLVRWPGAVAMARGALWLGCRETSRWTVLQPSGTKGPFRPGEFHSTSVVFDAIRLDLWCKLDFWVLNKLTTWVLNHFFSFHVCFPSGNFTTNQ